MKREVLLEHMKDFLRTRLRDSGTGDPPRVRVERQEIESIGPYPHAAVTLFDRYVNVEWFGAYEDYDPTGKWVGFLLTHVD